MRLTSPVPVHSTFNQVETHYIFECRLGQNGFEPNRTHSPISAPLETDIASSVPVLPVIESVVVSWLHIGSKKTMRSPKGKRLIGAETHNEFSRESSMNRRPSVKRIAIFAATV